MMLAPIPHCLQSVRARWIQGREIVTGGICGKAKAQRPIGRTRSGQSLREQLAHGKQASTVVWPGTVAEPV